MIRILLVEDHQSLSDNICTYLNSDYEVIPVYTLFDAEMLLETEAFDILILDLMLPDGDGLSFLKKLYETFQTQKTGVIVLTAKEGLNEKLTAFERGAADYLTKPFFMEELQVRIKLILKNFGKVDETHHIRFKDLILDPLTKTAKINSLGLDLNEKTYHLLEYLVLNKNILLYKEQLFDRVCGLDSDASLDIIEVYMSRLRKQLARSGYDQYLLTKRGMGYLLTDALGKELP